MKGIMRWLGRGWIGGLVALALACGDEDEEVSEAVAACQRLSSVWCERAVDCLVEVGSITERERVLNFDACYDVAIAAAQCKRAVTVSASYDTCIAQLDTIDCQMFSGPQESLNPMLPSACMGVIGIQ
jgi:hypothetical protein